ncbi:hypothetical protein PBAC_32320 [Pedobacter glucosidilyticus]|uniref:DUF4202 domain-containing protein n=1 Tax=Pedobacter aquae TaxID=2605747 RepID=A0A5C0VJ68_9SPHI|nr:MULTISPECIES: DUF4202 domain-containing protein [Pedobacter]KHJ36587.1 hypothetical protein PBAC_32320 [Pedobacter glucosidilyticus]QEK51823.1 DUF4202 domain-containing protein [Pedobacter aquae]
MRNMKAAFAAFDAYNQQDPNQIVYEGLTYPQEYFLALKLHEWVLTLNPKASLELLLASRCQHIGRWETPRKQYPEGREGYLKWRKEQANFHVDKSLAILRHAGFDETVCYRVKQIILKQKIKIDAEVQIMENALCLVFLQYQFEDFLNTQPDIKMIGILRKSLLKMDKHGHEHALKLPFSEKAKALVARALEELYV